MTLSPFQPHETKFRNSNNVLLLRGLFLETSSNRDTVVYTLRDQDYEGYPSLYRLYLETNDPTEYLFATTHLDSWEHWTTLCQSKWFQPYLVRWREELELKHRALALAEIIAKAKSGGRDALAAAKYLAEKAWDKQTKGRPSKAAISEEAHRIASEQRRLHDDLERLQMEGNA